MEKRDIVFEANGEKLAGWLHLPDGDSRHPAIGNPTARIFAAVSESKPGKVISTPSGLRENSRVRYGLSVVVSQNSARTKFAVTWGSRTRRPLTGELFRFFTHSIAPFGPAEPYTSTFEWPETIEEYTGCIRSPAQSSPSMNRTTGSQR